MNSPKRRTNGPGGFTLVELLTTLVVIGVLMALLVPAFNLVQKTAQNVRQKAQFNNISTALEGFRADFGYYPPSQPTTDADGDIYTNAHMLAEAVIGYDGFGVHPSTQWLASGTAPDGQGGRRALYLDADIPFADAAAEQASLQNRKGPYMEMEVANAVKMEDYWGPGRAPNISLALDRYVLADSFGRVTNQRTKNKTGMPILYYRANTNAFQHDPDNVLDSSSAAEIALNIYNIRQSWQIFENVLPFDAPEPHSLSTDSNYYLWYERTSNPNYYDADNPDLARPYRAESFILHSAGVDGLYGTPDDVFNFEEESK